MENPINRVAEHQRRMLDFMLDSLGLRHAHDEVVRRDRIAELETTVAALGAENRALWAEVRQLEHQLYPRESEIAAFEHEMNGRLALERERAAEDRIWSGPAPPPRSRTARRDLVALARAGALRRSGRGRTTHYLPIAAAGPAAGDAASS